MTLTIVGVGWFKVRARPDWVYQGELVLVLPGPDQPNVAWPWLLPRLVQILVGTRPWLARAGPDLARLDLTNSCKS